MARGRQDAARALRGQRLLGAAHVGAAHGRGAGDVGNVRVFDGMSEVAPTTRAASIAARRSRSRRTSPSWWNSKGEARKHRAPAIDWRRRPRQQPRAAASWPRRGTTWVRATQHFTGLLDRASVPGRWSRRSARRWRATYRTPTRCADALERERDTRGGPPAMPRGPAGRRPAAMRRSRTHPLAATTASPTGNKEGRWLTRSDANCGRRRERLGLWGLIANWELSKQP